MILTGFYLTIPRENSFCGNEGIFCGGCEIGTKATPSLSEIPGIISL
jgi:hypothetical protein